MLDSTDLSTQSSPERESIQRLALRLFADHGYDETTIADIAAFAGVPELVVRRYFPTKVDIVLPQPYQCPINLTRYPDLASVPIMQVVSNNLVNAVARYLANTPFDGLATQMRLMQLHPIVSRHHEARKQRAVDEFLTSAIAQSHRRLRFELPIAVAACDSAMNAAVRHWLNHDCTDDLLDLVAGAMLVLAEEWS